VVTVGIKSLYQSAQDNKHALLSQLLTAGEWGWERECVCCAKVGRFYVM
jgi:hypothetical protein